MWMAGVKFEKEAYVSVSLFGNALSDVHDKMTGQICDRYEKELGIWVMRFM